MTTNEENRVYFMELLIHKTINKSIHNIEHSIDGILEVNNMRLDVTRNTPILLIELVSGHGYALFVNDISSLKVKEDETTTQYILYFDSESYGQEATITFTENNRGEPKRPRESACTIN